MAVKKTAPKKDDSSTPTKATAKESAKTPTKAAAPKAAAPKAEAPAAAATKAPKAAKPKVPPVKLTTSQTELLKKVHGAGEGGYSAEKKIEERSLTALQEKKLIKKGAKDKESGKVPYSVSVTGKKHLDSQGGSGEIA